MDALSQPIQTLILKSAEIAEKPDPQHDYIFDASQLIINAAFVSHYNSFLAQIESDSHSRVLVVLNDYLALFPESVVVVPTLGEAEDVIEMERIERDLGF